MARPDAALLLAAAVGMAPRFLDALQASVVSACALQQAARRPGSLLTSHRDCSAREGALPFVGRAGAGAFIAEGACHE